MTSKTSDDIYALAQSTEVENSCKSHIYNYGGYDIYTEAQGDVKLSDVWLQHIYCAEHHTREEKRGEQYCTQRAPRRSDIAQRRATI